MVKKFVSKEDLYDNIYSHLCMELELQKHTPILLILKTLFHLNSAWELEVAGSLNKEI